MNRLIITFDYELFFGDEAGTVQNTLIKPTNSILAALGKSPAVFFVDYLMLKYMIAENDITKAEAALIIEQLKEIVKRGHRIELHLHPHWVDAKYIDGKWDFSDFSHYCLNSFQQEEITRMFVEGATFLESIAREVDSNYKINAFRAGGWCILPFSLLKEGFEKAGVLYDSSIIGGNKVYENGLELDFTSAPAKPTYSFSEDVLVEDAKGTFKEYQIGQLQFGLSTSLVNTLYHKLFSKNFVRLTDGTHDRKADGTIAPASKLSYLARSKRKAVISLDAYPPFLLRMLLRKNREKVITIMGHPKDITSYTCTNIKMLARHYKITTF